MKSGKDFLLRRESLDCMWQVQIVFLHKIVNEFSSYIRRYDIHMKSPTVCFF